MVQVRVKIALPKLFDVTRQVLYQMWALFQPDPLCVWTYVTLEPLSMIVDRYSGLDGSGGARRRLVTDLVLLKISLYAEPKLERNAVLGEPDCGKI